MLQVYNHEGAAYSFNFKEIPRALGYAAVAYANTTNLGFGFSKEHAWCVVFNNLREFIVSLWKAELRGEEGFSGVVRLSPEEAKRTGGWIKHTEEEALILLKLFQRYDLPDMGRAFATYLGALACLPSDHTYTDTAEAYARFVKVTIEENRSRFRREYAAFLYAQEYGDSDRVKQELARIEAHLAPTDRVLTWSYSSIIGETFEGKSFEIYSEAGEWERIERKEDGK